MIVAAGLRQGGARRGRGGPHGRPGGGCPGRPRHGTMGWAAVVQGRRQHSMAGTASWRAVRRAGDGELEGGAASQTAAGCGGLFLFWRPVCL
jgi:hypothetical protein